MTVIGTVGSLWRYPVKSMAGESLTEAFIGFAGFYGDRCYAIKNSASRKGFPYLSATVQQQMLLYRPKFRYPERAAKPPNLEEASNIAPGVNPADAEPEDMLLDVITPSGEVIAFEDPRLLEMLREGLRGENHLTVVRSNRALTDCRPVSLISLQTVRKIGEELGGLLDARRFRSNIYVDLNVDEGFAEDQWVGRKMRIGPGAVIALLERDPRCKMISIDPDTGKHNPEILRKVAKNHGNFAGLYCAVLVEGVVSEGDQIVVFD